MFRRLLIALLVVALMPASLSAAARPILAPQQPPLERSAPVLSVPGETGAAMTVVTWKRCQRGVSGFSSCGPDIGLPAGFAAGDSRAGTPGLVSPDSPMAGLMPPCLLDPPRSA